MLGVNDIQDAEIEQVVRQELENAGITQGDNLLVHSSFKSLGVKGTEGADGIIKGLLGAIGNHGTLLFPTLSYQFVTTENPVFDVRLTKSCVGFLSEYFRNTYAEGRSMHPTHSVAGLGANLSFFLGDHHEDVTPLGEHSPYRRLWERKGKILMIGCGLMPNTSMHGIEELVSPDYLFGEPLTYKLISNDNQVQSKTLMTHGFEGVHQRYDRIREVMPPESLIKTSLLGAEMYVIDCDQLWTTVHHVLQSEPWFFVDRSLAN